MAPIPNFIWVPHPREFMVAVPVPLLINGDERDMRSWGQGYGSMDYAEASTLRMDEPPVRRGRRIVRVPPLSITNQDGLHRREFRPTSSSPALQLSPVPCPEPEDESVNGQELARLHFQPDKTHAVICLSHQLRPDDIPRPLNIQTSTGHHPTESSFKPSNTRKKRHQVNEEDHKAIEPRAKRSRPMRVTSHRAHAMLETQIIAPNSSKPVKNRHRPPIARHARDFGLVKIFPEPKNGAAGRIVTTTSTNGTDGDSTLDPLFIFMVLAMIVLIAHIRLLFRLVARHYAVN